MAKQTINVGASANDGTGDNLRSAGQKINANFTELYDFNTGIAEIIDDRVSALLVAGSNITLTYNDAAGTLTIDAAGGSGSGSASTTTFTPVGGISATNVQAAIAELDTEKAPTVHTHIASNITDFAEAVDDRVATLLQSTSTVLVTYNDALNKITLDVVGGGDGGTDDQVAAEVPFTPTGAIASTNVQGAITELDTEKTAVSDLASTSSGKGAALVGFKQAGTGAVTRTVQDKAREVVSLLDFGADPTGATDSTAAMVAAVVAADANGGTLRVPAGTYQIDRAGVLQYAGIKIVGDGPWKTKFIAPTGATGPMLWNSLQASGTSGLVEVSGIFFDLNDQDIVALDMGSVNNALIQHCFFEGGPSKAGAVGTGIKFHAPLLSASYDNVVVACRFRYLTNGVRFDSGGNANEMHGCNATNCDIGWNTTPTSGSVDTPRIFGGRVEGCNIGLKEGASYGHYFGIRFEANTTSDIDFATSSSHPKVYGGYTASSATPLTNLANSTGPQILSDELGEWNLESSTARPRHFSGRAVYAAAGQTPVAHSLTNYAAYFQDYTLYKNNVGIEFGNNSSDNSIIGMFVDANNNLVISGFNRKGSVNQDVILGRGIVRPNSSAAQDLGTASVQWRNLRLSGGVYVGANQVVAARQTGTAANATDLATAITLVNDLKAKLVAHGLIS
jgi:hypothetical protein